MNIDPDGDYSGVPNLELRRLMKVASAGVFSWSVRGVQEELRIGAAKAELLIQNLAREGLIEPLPASVVGWRNTTKGNALGLASAARPLQRKTADRLLKAFLRRVHQLNEPDSGFLYTADQVALFGSMLTDKPRVSDIDLSVQICRKPVPNGDWHAASQLRVKKAEQLGRQFRDFMETLIWPEVEVKLFLKNRSRGISLIEWNDEWLASQPHRIIYSRTST